MADAQNLASDVVERLESLGIGESWSKETLQAELEAPSCSSLWELVEQLTRALSSYDSALLPVAAAGQPEVDGEEARIAGLSRTLARLQFPEAQDKAKVSEWFGSLAGRVRILEFLIGEIQAHMLIRARSGSSKRRRLAGESDDDTAPADRPTAFLLRLAAALGLDGSATPREVLDKAVLSKDNDDTSPFIVRRENLTDDMLQQLHELHSALKEEYSLRRQMLLTRLDVTAESFTYSERGARARGEIQSLHDSIRSTLSKEPSVQLTDVFRVRESSVRIEQANRNPHTKTLGASVKKVLIGAVPDRGGRVGEADAPQANMPAFRPRTVTSGRVQGGWSRGGRGGGRGGRGRGGRGRGRK